VREAVTVATKICADPDCPEQGIPQRVTAFCKNARERDGRQRRCKVCQGRAIDASRKKRFAREAAEDAAAARGES
jgi:hypothetical protein